jgi:hypothetical protein
VLGSPNIVTTDDQRREVWTYDRFSTETVTSSSAGGIAALIFGGGGGSGGGGVVPGVGRTAAAETRTQRTLTVIIKFDDQKRVRDFAYHASQF